MTDIRINFRPNYYPDNTYPKGFLSKDIRAQACWHFYTLAQQMKEKVGDSIEDQFGLHEEYPWMDTHYVQLAKSIALIYGLESPDEFAKAWKEVRLEAARLSLPAPHDSYAKLAPRVVLS